MLCGRKPRPFPVSLGMLTSWEQLTQQFFVIISALLHPKGNIIVRLLFANFFVHSKCKTSLFWHLLKVLHNNALGKCVGVGENLAVAAWELTERCFVESLTQAREISVEKKQNWEWCSVHVSRAMHGCCVVLSGDAGVVYLFVCLADLLPSSSVGDAWLVHQLHHWSLMVSDLFLWVPVDCVFCWTSTLRLLYFIDACLLLGVEIDWYVWRDWRLKHIQVKLWKRK